MQIIETSENHNKSNFDKFSDGFKAEQNRKIMEFKNIGVEKGYITTTDIFNFYEWEFNGVTSLNNTNSREIQRLMSSLVKCKIFFPPKEFGVGNYWKYNLDNGVFFEKPKQPYDFFVLETPPIEDQFRFSEEMRKEIIERDGLKESMINSLKDEEIKALSNLGKELMIIDFAILCGRKGFETKEVLKLYETCEIKVEKEGRKLNMVLIGDGVKICDPGIELQKALKELIEKGYLKEEDEKYYYNY